MKSLKSFSVTLFLVLVSFSSNAIGEHFYSLNNTEGLNLNTVLSLYQDERNYIWLGTSNGVKIYKGGQVTSYKHDKSDPLTLPNNEIKQIIGDHNGHVYLRTGDKCIVEYSIASATFKVLVSGSVNFIHFNNGLYYSTGSEIYRYDFEKSEAELLYSFENINIIISSIYKDSERLYIGTYGQGLYILENNNLNQVVSKGYIHDIFKDSKGLFWLTSVYGDGVYVLDGEKVINYTNKASDPKTLSSDKTHRCCEDKDGNIWIGTLKGLNKFDRKTGEFIRFPNTEFSNESVTSVLCDHQGTIWVATYYFGVFYSNPDQQYYQVFRQGYSESEGLSSAVISRIVEDNNKNLWIATSTGGLNRYNLETGDIKWYKNSGQFNSISSDNIKSLCYDESRNCMWIGTHLGGLDRLNINSGRVYNYRHDPRDAQSIPSNIITDIIKWEKNLIIASKGTISVFNPYNGTSKPLFQDNNYSKITGHCNQLLLDSRGRLWIAHTSSGAFCYNLETEKMMIFSNDKNLPGGISSGRINHMFEDSKGRIWLCNNQNGLDLYDENNGSFINFDVENSGIASNTVYAICEIEPDKYILTSDLGYTILNSETRETTNYINNQNHPLSSATEKCLYKTSDGRIFIGGMNGMISFDSSRISSLPRNYDISPYVLSVDGVEVKPGDSSEILDKDLSYTSSISLSPNVNSIQLEYAVTDYLPYDRDRILYRLRNYTESWSVLPDNHTISFTKLPPGVYTLEVRSESQDGSSGIHHELEIRVKRPFYKTIWAIIIYLILAIILVWIIFKTYHNHIRLQETIKFEKQSSKREKELNQHKLRFFTNISHEFRTPLTVIIAQIELLMENTDFDKHTHSALTRIYKNCVLLKELIGELLDFRKQEQGYLKLRVSEKNIVSYVNELYLNFLSYAKKKHISYKFFKLYDDIPAWFDTKQLQKAINNLIINAFSHVQENGSVTVSVNKDSSNVVIDVTNTGQGIKADDINKIFDRFYQSESSYSGTGIGLALAKGIIDQHCGRIEVFSEPDKETRFRVFLPLGANHFTPEQLVRSQEEPSPVLVNQSAVSDILLQETEEELELPKNSEVKTVLIVEDSDSLRQTLVELFSPFYNVLAASDGEQAYELALKVVPDLVVSDVMISNLSGLQLCRKLKASDITSLVPVVLLTSKSDDAQKIEAYKYGIDDYVVKPFNSKLLVSRCNNLVNIRTALEEKYSEVKSTSAKTIVANSETDKRFLIKAKEIVLKHILDNTFNIEVLARELGVSRTKLFTRLKDIQGVTPLEFIMDIKIDEAAKLLKENPEYNISEVSDRAGFSSPKYFRKYFKNKYGMTPIEFRNLN